uniref:ATP-dependent RNA helicase DDX1 n=1 Tax=Myxine glutinosa TaxID=7769 RepID=UPI00358FAECF
MAAFSEMGVMPEIAQAIEEMDWLLPTDIQSESIPLILGGGDVLMAAETGSGKTGAFSIPVIQIVYETIKDQQEGKGGKAAMKTGGGVFNTWQMNPYDRDSAFAIGSQGFRCQSREAKSWHGCRSTKGLTKGKYYYEVVCHDDGLCRVGWSTDRASLDLGTDRFGFGFGGTGKKSNNKQFDSYGEPFTMHDCIGCYIDMDNGIVKYSKNGIDLGVAFEIPAQMRSGPMFAACVLKNAELEFNFGDSDLLHPPEDGFLALNKALAAHMVTSDYRGSTQVTQDKKQINAPHALIIEPSRELAEQTCNNIRQCKKFVVDPKIKELLIIGGVAAKDQLQALEDGVHIIVGTPGRIDDLISTGKLSLSQVRFFVLDEADGLLTAGCTEFIHRVHAKIPQITSDGKRLQVIVCSATLHSFDVKKLAEKIMHFPVWVDLKGEDSVPETVHHVVVPISPKLDNQWERLGQNRIKTDGVHQKDNTRPGANTPEMWSEAVKLLKGEFVVRAIREHKMDQAIIFCRTKLDCDNLERLFIQLGGGSDKKDHQFSCVCLHSDRKPPERKTNLESFKKKIVRFLICTDVAARGIDIGGVPFVINVTLPDEKQNYVHRIGRVGRAERMGLALSLVSKEKEKVWYHVCPNRGRGCYNTRLKSEGGCTIWYNEQQYLADIEEHLKMTIEQVEPDIKIPVNEFDGKVVYGKRKTGGVGMYKGHVDVLAPTVQELAVLETQAQSSFLHLGYMPNQLFRRF